MTLLVRYAEDGRTRIGVSDGLEVRLLPVADLAEVLRLPVDEARTLMTTATSAATPLREVRLLAPVDRQEVWGAGVTYMRSRDARLEESGGADVYDRVYVAPRPELFFKAAGWRSVGPGEPVGVRVDSPWNLPEPEVTVAVNAHREIFGYTVGNDVSSRSIEGENALYLPQAKVYTASCAVGPGIRPAWELDDAPVFDVTLSIRRAGAEIAAGAVRTTEMKRGFPDLVSWLTCALDFPDGALLMTGTGIVPGGTISLSAGDEVTVEIEGIGKLTNPVVAVGSPAMTP